MPLVAGIDSSTQSCKIAVCGSETGTVIAEGRAPHPDGTEVDPKAWWDALDKAADGLLDEVEAVAVAGQQHGMVALDNDGDVVRPALLWNDTRSAGAAKDLVAELGGRHAWAEAVGSVPVASFTVAKLRWLAENEPENAKRVEQVMLPHDWLTHRLLHGKGEPVTDRGDASGTGYWSPVKNAYRSDILAKAFGREVAVPRVARPAEIVGETAKGVVVAPGTGDNMGAALGLGIKSGDVVVSLGTSGTVFAVADDASKDASGMVAGFADATGRYLPLVCTLNAARVLTSTAAMLGADLHTFDKLALQAEPGAGGIVLLPYLDGERTPNLPDATGSLVGLTRGAMTPQNLARAAVEGMICGLADGIDALSSQGVSVERVLLVGGGAQSNAVRSIAADLFAVPVVVPKPAEYVARGAARQAAWALSGAATPPDWPLDLAASRKPNGGDSGWTVRDAYAKARHFVHGV
jgi:xylulokinase